MEESELYKKGLEMRKKVLGDEYVEKALKSATNFSMPLQELATEWAWGAVWTRPGLTPKTRSLINLAMFVALGNMTELRVHVRGAIRNGCTVDEISEVLYQATVYCGVPAGVDAFKAAEEVLKEEGLV